MEDKMLDRAIQIACNAHFGVEDKGGKPYILHPLWVMNKVRHLGTYTMQAAVLHDVIEDTNWTIDMLRKEGFSEYVLQALMLLTHDKAITYEEYINKIDTNAIAREVKLRDLEHNSKITRLKGVTEKDLERIEKYHRAYLFLKS